LDREKLSLFAEKWQSKKYHVDGEEIKKKNT
jgi:hypothetical protein